MSNCDFGSPCDCSECRSSNMEVKCPKCKKKHVIKVRREAKWTVGRKGDGDYTFLDPELSKNEMICEKCA